MPQDKLRFVDYRSFITCDDPKGVVECRPIRKSKTDSQKLKGKEGKVEIQRMPKNLNKSSSNKEEKEETVSKATADELHNPSSFQIMEVSRGAHKLNQMIDSWSKGMSVDGLSKDIAKDLLRGALDLQESLTMLGKLQEASQYMANLKKKHKEKDEGEVGIERSNLNPFGNHNYQLGFQNPRLSANGPSRDCFDELREVIRDSLARQNLLPNGSSEEKAYFGRRKVDLSPDMPSSSSSRSSMVYSHDFSSSEFSSSSRVPEEKPKGSNLIAKLMGLEEIPSKSLQSAPQKQLERDKILNQRKPTSDIDMPKPRKPQFVVRKSDREQMTLEEIIEIMQVKGLLKSNKHQTHHSNTSHLVKRSSDDGPPIVIMKPSHPVLEAEELRLQKFIPEEGALDTQEMSRNGKTKEEVPSKIIDHRKGDFNSSEMRRKLVVEETPIKKLHREKGAKDCKVAPAKPEDKEVKFKERPPSNKPKASVPVSPKPLKQQAIEKEVENIQKMTPSRRKPVEMENAKSTSTPETHEQGKVAFTKLRKPESGSNITRNRIPQQKSSTSNSSSKHITSATSHKSSDRKKSVKNEKPVGKPLATNIVNIGCKDDDTQIDLTCKIKSDTSITNTTSAVQLLTEKETDASEILIKDNSANSQNSLSEATLLTTQHESGAKSPEEANCCIDHNKNEKQCCQTRTNLLLSSPSLLSHAEDLFHIDVYQPIVFQTTNLHDSGTANSTLLLDCANELLELKRLRHIPTVYPLLLTPIVKSRFCISMDQLEGEVRGEIDNLRSYSKLSGKSLPADTVYAVLQRDLWYKGVVVGAWDLGWRDGFTVDEIEQVVGNIDKLLLSELIEELFKDFQL